MEKVFKFYTCNSQVDKGLEMHVVSCPVDGCGYRTADTGDAAASVLLKFHLDSQDSTSSPSMANEQIPKLQLERARINAGAGTDDWSNFLHDWQTYKDVS